MNPYRSKLGNMGRRKEVGVPRTIVVVLGWDCERSSREFTRILMAKPHSLWTMVKV